MTVLILRIVLLLVALVNVYGCWSMNRRLAGVSKVFLVPLVIAIYLSKLAADAAAGGTVPFAALSIPLLIGLLCGWAGDLFLLKESLFAAGLCAFLAGHICYIAAFLRDLPAHPATFVLPIAAAIYLLYILWLKKRLIPYVPKEMKLPVVVYMIAIAAMSAMSLLRFSTAGEVGFAGPLWTVIGTVLFVASDSILAFRVFKRDVGSFMEVGVMATYVGAQFLIMWGMAIA